MKKNLISSLVAIVAGVTIVGCSSTSSPTQKAPGFLPDYALLQPVVSESEDTKVYIYKNANVKRSDYHAVIVDPVILYQTATDGGITDVQIADAKQVLSDDLKQGLRSKIKIATKPGVGVARLNVAITGAELEGDGFKPWNLIPISAAIVLASKATGLDNKKPILVIETKVTDSLSNKLLSASYTTISGEKFRTKSATPQEFMKLAKVWVKDAVRSAVPNSD